MGEARKEVLDQLKETSFKRSTEEDKRPVQKSNCEFYSEIEKYCLYHLLLIA